MKVPTSLIEVRHAKKRLWSRVVFFLLAVQNLLASLLAPTRDLVEAVFWGRS